MAKTLLAISLLVGAGACSSPAPTAHRSGSTVPPAVEPEPTTTVTEPPTTTSTAPEPVEEAPVATRTTRARSAPTTIEYVAPSPQSQTTRQDGGAAPLACIRSYEGDYGTDTGNGYYGAYQFDLQTWRSVGGTGLPSDAEPWEQDMRAGMLYDLRGLAPWPKPAVMCR